MVFFTCNACGQSLKKSHVEKHCTSQCRNCEMLSCIDCGKDFWGEEYKTHIKCISEEEKYSGKDYKAKPNKGEEKQESWMQLIQTTIDTATDLQPDLLNFLKQLVTYNNVPRKQSKFENYVRNSMRIQNENLISRAWEVFNSAHKAASEKKTETDSRTPSKDEAQPPSTENEEKKKKKAKPSDDDDQSPEKERAITASNPEEVANDDNSSPKKKHKKRKHSGLEDETAGQVVMEETDGKRKKRKKGKHGEDEAVESKNDVNEKREDGDAEGKETIPPETDQKKSKKRKSETITADEIVNAVNEVGSKESKKHKKRKDSIEAVGDEQIVNSGMEQAVNGEESLPDNSSNKKHKKDKKRNKEEKTGEAEPSPAQQLMPDGAGDQEELSKSAGKKHKKSKKNKGEADEIVNVADQLTPQQDISATDIEGSSKKSKKSKKKSGIAADGSQDENESPTKTTNGKFPKHEDGRIEENGSTPCLQKPGKFKWAKIAETVLLQTPDKTLSVKKLKKRVFAEYVSRTSDANGENEQELEETFADKVTKNERFQIEGKQIRLVA